MATNAKKKKKKGFSKSDRKFLIGLVVVLLAVGGYVFATWDRPTHDPEALVGRWYYDTSGLSVGTLADSEEVPSTYWDFGEDQSFLIFSSDGGKMNAGSYAVEGETLTLTLSGVPEAFEFIVKGNALVLGSGEDAVKLTRAK